MKPVYKKVKVSLLLPYCPKCKKRLTVNNSDVLPYECDCGEWVSDKYPFTGEYEIKPKIK